MKRKYPENRNPEVRLASRKASYEKNKKRWAEAQKAKRQKSGDWWAGVLERIEKIVAKVDSESK